MYSSTQYLGYQAVKEGFCWPAFFFTWFWAFAKKMWIEGLKFMAMFYLLVMAVALTGGSKHSVFGKEFVPFFVWLGYHFYVGSIGNEWRRKRLERRGFKHIEIVEAETPDAAISSVVSSPEKKEAI